MLSRLYVCGGLGLTFHKHAATLALTLHPKTTKADPTTTNTSCAAALARLRGWLPSVDSWDARADGHIYPLLAVTGLSFPTSPFLPLCFHSYLSGLPHTPHFYCRGLPPLRKGLIFPNAGTWSCIAFAALYEADWGFIKINRVFLFFNFTDTSSRLLPARADQ